VTKITPDHEPHEKLLRDVQAWLHERGFAFSSLAYHDVLKDAQPALADRIARMWDATAIVMRHRPDRIAVHGQLPLAFWWEGKTKGKFAPSSEAIYVDLCTLIATYHRDPDLRTLFVHRNQHSGLEVGFWASDVPDLGARVKISRAKWGDSTIAGWYARQARYIFGKNVSIGDHTGGGSGDPFVVIPHGQVVGLRHWTTLVEEAMQEVQEPCPHPLATGN
jgi:hypothetical protein